MFWVTNINSGSEYKVYTVRYDASITHTFFLIYKNGNWIWVSSEYYVPADRCS